MPNVPVPCVWGENTVVFWCRSLVSSASSIDWAQCDLMSLKSLAFNQCNSDCECFLVVLGREGSKAIVSACCLSPLPSFSLHLVGTSSPPRSNFHVNLAFWTAYPKIHCPSPESPHSLCIQAVTTESVLDTCGYRLPVRSAAKCPLSLQGI